MTVAVYHKVRLLSISGGMGGGGGVIEIYRKMGGVKGFIGFELTT